MLGFKEDFESSRSPLALEEREMVQFQAAGEFNKKFWKPDEFKKDLPEEKVKSFSKILGKFFDVEAADYNKEVEAKVPSYKLLEKAGDKVLGVAMSGIVGIDRDADRRYDFATRKMKKAAEKGEMFPQSSPIRAADRYRTKADVLRSFWAEHPKYSNEPAPPLDDVMLADLEEAPAVQEGEFRRSRGVADKLYKSDAVGAFGIKCLLGV